MSLRIEALPDKTTFFTGSGSYLGVFKIINLKMIKNYLIYSIPTFVDRQESITDLIKKLSKVKAAIQINRNKMARPLSNALNPSPRHSKLFLRLRTTQYIMPGDFYIIHFAYLRPPSAHQLPRRRPQRMLCNARTNAI